MGGDDPVAERAIAARIWDRTPGTAPPVQMGMVFSRLDCKPRWRERLPEIEVPALVLKEAATAIPDAEVGEVTEAMLTLG